VLGNARVNCADLMRFEAHHDPCQLTGVHGADVVTEQPWSSRPCSSGSPAKARGPSSSTTRPAGSPHGMDRLRAWHSDTAGALLKVKCGAEQQIVRKSLDISRFYGDS